MCACASNGKGAALRGMRRNGETGYVGRINRAYLCVSSANREGRANIMSPQGWRAGRETIFWWCGECFPSQFFFVALTG